MSFPSRKEVCALYIRVSTEDQSEKYSLSSQKRAQLAYAEQRGYIVSETFCDDGYTAEHLDRPALERLRDLVRKRLVDVVVVYELDRLVRKVSDHIILQEEFEKAGVRCEYVNFSVSNDDEGKLMVMIRAVMAEYEKVKLKERTLRGRKEKALQGCIVGGRRTFGYSVSESGRYTICNTEAEIVRGIFLSFVDANFSIRQIVFNLNQQGLKPHTACRWAKSTVHRILGNESYVGRSYYNRRRRIQGNAPSISKRDKKTRHEWKERVEWIDVPVPAIISEGVFAAAQAKLRRNREQRSGRPPKHFWLLRGLLRCARCNRKFASYPSRETRYYRCSAVDKIATHQCDAPKIKAAELEASVIMDLKKLLDDPRLIEDRLSRHTREERDLDGDLATVESRLKELRSQEAKLLNKFLSDAIAATVIDQKGRELRAEREKLERTRQRLMDAISFRAERTNIADAATTYCKKIKKHLATLDFEKKRKIVEALIEEIVIDGSVYQIQGAISFATASSSMPQQLSTTFS